MKVYENKCECIKFDCGCCQYLKWNVLSLDGECNYLKSYRARVVKDSLYFSCFDFVYMCSMRKCKLLAV